MFVYKVALSFLSSVFLILPSTDSDYDVVSMTPSNNEKEYGVQASARIPFFAISRRQAEA